MSKERIPDRRALKKTMSDLTRLIERKKFGSNKEIDNYLNGILKKGEMPNAPPKSAVGLAQDIMYEAWDTSDEKERIKLAREAMCYASDSLSG